MMKLSRMRRWFDLSRHPLAAVPLILALCLGFNGLAHADVTDNFDRDNGGLGTKWTKNVISDSELQIVAHQVQETYGQYSESLYTDSTLGGNQFTEVQYVTGFYQGVINLRVRARQYTTSGTGDGYTGQIFSSGWGSTWRILRVDNEVETELLSGSYTYADGDTFYFEANGTTLTLKKNGTTLGSVTDSSPGAYATGDAGFGIYDHSTLALDNWRGGELGSGSDTTPPSAPSGLSATATSSTQINLSWTASTDNVGVTGYRVERCQGASCSSFAQIATPTTNSYSDTGLTASTSYSYRVRAVDAAGNLSGYSTTVGATTGSGATPPTPPTGVATIATSSSEIDIGWFASTTSGSLAGYEVERCQGSGCTNFALAGTTTDRRSNNQGLAASTTYRFRVRAKDSANNYSGYSTTLDVTTPTNSLDCR